MTRTTQGLGFLKTGFFFFFFFLHVNAYTFVSYCLALEN